MLARVSLLGQLDVYLDPWAPDYGSDLPGDAPDTADDTLDVDPDVELPRARWRALAADPDRPLPPSVAFIDGVRRLEARLRVRGPDGLAHGAFGSLGAGAAVCAGGVAAIAETRIERVLALGSGLSLPAPVAVSPGLAYEPLSSADTQPDAPLARLQEAMRAAEERLAQELSAGDDTLVVCDGPLRPAAFGGGGGPLVGYVKRLHETYLDAALMPTVAGLPPGTRTPLFALRAPERFARLAWFLRLAAPQPGDLDLAGLVRLEVADDVGLETARRLADACAALLPRFAPSRGRDPRAPQNLLPIGALERHLRRLLGDPRVIRRHIEDRLRAPAPPPARGVHERLSA